MNDSKMNSFRIFVIVWKYYQAVENSIYLDVYKSYKFVAIDAYDASTQLLSDTVDSTVVILSFTSWWSNLRSWRKQLTVRSNWIMQSEEIY